MVTKVIKPVILVVEDHDALRYSLKNWLKTIFSECNIFEAKTGEEAFEIAVSESPDIILMDIKLPMTDGIKTTQKIKARLPGTCVVILSMYDGSEYRSAAEIAGVNAYIPKYKMYNELMPILKGLLSKAGKN